MGLILFWGMVVAGATCIACGAALSVVSLMILAAAREET